MRALGFFMERAAMPVMRWCATEIAVPVPAHDSYVTPENYVNPVVLAATQRDVAEFLRVQPEQYQAVLNACLESIRGLPEVADSIPAFMGGMVASGHDPREALLRVCANFLLQGMVLQVRVGLEFPLTPAYPPAGPVVEPARP